MFFTTKIARAQNGFQPLKHSFIAFKKEQKKFIFTMHIASCNFDESIYRSPKTMHSNQTFSAQCMMKSKTLAKTSILEL